MIRVSFRVMEGADVLEGKFAALGKIPGRLTRASRRVANEVVYPSIQKNFAAGGRPKWRRLSPAYEKRKLKKWGSKPILTASGKARKALSGPRRSPHSSRTIRGNRFIIRVLGSTHSRTGLFYMLYHQSRKARVRNREGRVRLPRRPFMQLQPEEKKKAKSIFVEEAKAVAKGTTGRRKAAGKKRPWGRRKAWRGK
jgi:phage gpG-like protein